MTAAASARTLFVDARVVRAGATGVGSWTAGILSALDALVGAGVSVRVVALRMKDVDHAVWRSLRSVEVITTEVDYESHPRGDLFMQRELVPLALRHGAEALVSPAFLAPAMDSRGASPIRRVVFVHDLFAFDGSVPMSPGFRWYLRTMMSAALRRCEVIGTSSAVARRAISRRSGVPTLFAPPAIDARFGTPGSPMGALRDGSRSGASQGDRPRGALPDGSPRRGPLLVYTASFEPRKNHRMLFDAVRGAGWDLVLLHGSDWPGGQLPSGVRVIKPSGVAEIAAWTAAADVALFPSFVEGFGIPMLEALACATPLIAADIPAARWLTGGGRAAKLILPDNPDAWRAAIAAVVDGSDTGVASRRAAGLRRSRGFSWSASARRILRAALPSVDVQPVGAKGLEPLTSAV